MIIALFCLIILISGVGCQPENPQQPTPSPTYESPITLATLPPTRSHQAIQSAVTPSPPSPTVRASLPTPVMVQYLVGESAEGRVITARRFGTGERMLLFVGGIHAGTEANTVQLVEELMQHFSAQPDDVLPGFSLLFIPNANPDGLNANTRMNANAVDLNRNWGCNWSPEARWRNQAVSAGKHAFSEPETQALSAFITYQAPEVVLFYHSAAGGVFAGNCERHVSDAMAAVLGEATGYSYGSSFSAYPVTGTAAAWVDSQGIPSADVELFSNTETEFTRNLNGIMALQRWLLAEAP